MLGNQIRHRIWNMIFWLSLMICVFASAQTEVRVLGGYGCKGWIEMVPKKPFLGDNVTITFTITSPYKNTPEFRVEWKRMMGAEVTRGDIIQYHQPLKIGDTAQFSIDVTITAYHLIVRGVARAHITDRYTGDEWGYTLAVAGVDKIVLAEHDTVSYEKFGHNLEIWSRIGPEYLYDVQAGARMTSIGMPYREEAEKIRAQIESLKEKDPTLTDWDALELMHEAYEDMHWRFGIHDREEARLILLEARKLTREQGLEKWEAVKQVIEKLRKENGSLNFIHDGNHINKATNLSDERIDITISGTF